MRKRIKQFRLTCLAVLLAAGVLFSSSARAQVVDSVPSDSTPMMGDTITVNVKIAGVTDLYSISFDLIYSSAMLSYDNTTEGDLLHGGWTATGSADNYHAGGTVGWDSW